MNIGLKTLKTQPCALTNAGKLYRHSDIVVLHTITIVFVIKHKLPEHYIKRNKINEM